KKGEQTAMAKTEEQTSWRKPGSVSTAERTPPPGTSAHSRTTTDFPACAIRMAAASPFGPEPTAMASVVGRSNLVSTGTHCQDKSLARAERFSAERALLSLHPEFPRR